MYKVNRLERDAYAPIIQRLDLDGYVTGPFARESFRRAGCSEESALYIPYSLRNAKQHGIARRDYHLETFYIGNIAVRYDPVKISEEEIPQLRGRVLMQLVAEKLFLGESERRDAAA